ncbi:MAG TPA: IPT/TIG domain-containing protein, partial [Chloroflexota bacterium]|nr:IPT/TIG domain-containing protein [Chloroflexota bacterium]
NVIAEGQTILMRPTRGATSLGFLGASANITRSCTLTIKYTDGSTSKKVITLADWGVPAAPGNIVVAHMKYRNTFKGPETKNGFSIFLAKTAVVKSKTVASIHMSKTVLGNQSLRIFAIALNGTWAPEKPLIASLTPPSGPAVGGTKVTIYGDYLAGATAVHFGPTTKAGSFVVLSDHSISATSPAGTGTVDISVSGPAGTNLKTTGDRFTYLP